MKIAFIIHSLCVGGAEMIAVEYLIKLNKMGQDVCLIEFSHVDSYLYDKLKDRNIRVITLTNRKNGVIHKAYYKLFGADIVCKSLNNLLKIEKFDILHIHTGLGSIKYLNFDKNKVFYSFHTSVERNLSVLGNKHRKNILRFAKEGMNFFVLSHEMKVDAQKVLPTDKIYELPNGLDFEEIRGKRYKRNEFLTKLGIAEDAFVLCHVARMHPVKNHIKTIDVFNEVVKKRSNAYLLLIGQTEDSILSQINVLIERYFLQPRVKILGNRVDATAIMGICDAMVLPSFAEGFSLVALEAQVLGTRCVLTDKVPDEVVCNENCFTLSIDINSEKWATYVLGDFINEHPNHLNDLDINVIANRLFNYYRQS